MTREEAQIVIGNIPLHPEVLDDCYSITEYQEAKTMAIKALEQEPRWIPVSERLPESDEEYHTFLVTDRKGKVTLSEFYLSIKDKKPYWSGMIDVIAWMPLPKPYKAESEDEE